MSELLASFLVRFLADPDRDDSLLTKLRWKMMSRFRRLISSLPKPVRILDVGGTESFWVRMRLAGREDLQITILNLFEAQTNYRNMVIIKGDARNIHEYGRAEFDVTFSNDVLEHVGTLDDQRKMAYEIRRIGKRYFVHTPNFYFPYEGHFQIPCDQFLPLSLRISLLQHLQVGWFPRTPEKEKARQAIDSVRLMKKFEFEELFPEAMIEEFRVFKFPFSLLAIKW